MHLQYMKYHCVTERLLSALSISSEHIQKTRRSEHASGSHLQEVKGKLDNLQTMRPKSWFAYISSGHSCSGHTWRLDCIKINNLNIVSIGIFKLPKLKSVKKVLAVLAMKINIHV